MCSILYPKTNDISKFMSLSFYFFILLLVECSITSRQTDWGNEWVHNMFIKLCKNCNVSNLCVLTNRGEMKSLI